MNSYMERVTYNKTYEEYGPYRTPEPLAIKKENRFLILQHNFIQQVYEYSNADKEGFYKCKDKT